MNREAGSLENGKAAVLGNEIDEKETEESGGCRLRLFRLFTALRSTLHGRSVCKEEAILWCVKKMDSRSTQMNAHMPIRQRDASSHMQAVRSRIRYPMLQVYTDITDSHE